MTEINSITYVCCIFQRSKALFSSSTYNSLSSHLSFGLVLSPKMFLGNGAWREKKDVFLIHLIFSRGSVCLCNSVCASMYVCMSVCMYVCMCTYAFGCCRGLSDKCPLNTPQVFEYFFPLGNTLWKLTLLEEMQHWKQALRFYSLIPLPVCPLFHACGQRYDVSIPCSCFCACFLRP